MAREKQIRCKICDRVIASYKNPEREFCAYCNRDYKDCSKRKWVAKQKTTHAQLTKYLRTLSKGRRQHH